VQGVYQVLPWSVDWLHRAGEAGRLIDPAAHAHINLVGGVAMAIAGFVYYFLPRVTGRPIFSRRLANASFFILAAGVLSFWLGLIVLGFVEGNMIIDQDRLRESEGQGGIWHRWSSAAAEPSWAWVLAVHRQRRAQPLAEASPRSQ
jgi:hypothetical protein